MLLILSELFSAHFGSGEAGALKIFWYLQSLKIIFYPEFVFFTGRSVEYLVSSFAKSKILHVLNIYIWIFIDFLDKIFFLSINLHCFHVQQDCLFFHIFIIPFHITFCQLPIKILCPFKSWFFFFASWISRHLLHIHNMTFSCKESLFLFKLSFTAFVYRILCKVKYR